MGRNGTRWDGMRRNGTGRYEMGACFSACSFSWPLPCSSLPWPASCAVSSRYSETDFIRSTCSGRDQWEGWGRGCCGSDSHPPRTRWSTSGPRPATPACGSIPGRRTGDRTTFRNPLTSSAGRMTETAPSLALSVGSAYGCISCRRAHVDTFGGIEAASQSGRRAAAHVAVPRTRCGEAATKRAAHP